MIDTDTTVKPLISTHVNAVRLVLTHNGVPFDLHDLETDTAAS